MFSFVKAIAFYATLIPSMTKSFSPILQQQNTNFVLTKLNLSCNNDSNEQCQPSSTESRRKFMSQTLASITTTFFATTSVAQAESSDGFNFDDFLKTGQVSMPMGVSGQAGKSKPETGIVFRDGSELNRDSKSGNVLTEILLNVQSDDPTAIVTSFSSPWPLGTLNLFVYFLLLLFPFITIIYLLIY